MTATAAREAIGPLGIGCWAFGRTGWGEQRDEDSFAAMDAAWRRGVRHWDTAIAYGDGHSERLLGEFLRGRRDEVCLATKGVPGEHPDSIIGLIESSLEHLETDRIDIYYLHWPRRGIDLRPHAERLEQLRERGVLRWIGVSNFSVEDMRQVGEACHVDVHQTCLNLFWRRAEADVMPYCTRHDIAVVAYSPLAQGILAGRFAEHPTFADNDGRRDTVFFRPEVWPELHGAVGDLQRLAASVARPVHHLALQWVAHERGVSIVVGVRNGQQAEDAATALRDPIPAELLQAATAISDRVCTHLPDVPNIFAYDP